MIYTLLLLSGTLVGFTLGFGLSRRHGAVRALQEQLLAKEAELSLYQDQVAKHFEKTADLFAELQVRQDNLVTHLQDGAKRLRGGMIDTGSFDVIALEGYKTEAPKDYPVGVSG